MTFPDNLTISFFLFESNASCAACTLFCSLRVLYGGSASPKFTFSSSYSLNTSSCISKNISELHIINGAYRSHLFQWFLYGSPFFSIRVEDTAGSLSFSLSSSIISNRPASAPVCSGDVSLFLFFKVFYTYILLFCLELSCFTPRLCLDNPTADRGNDRFL